MGWEDSRNILTKLALVQVYGSDWEGLAEHLLKGHDGVSKFTGAMFFAMAKDA